MATKKSQSKRIRRYKQIDILLNQAPHIFKNEESRIFTRVVLDNERFDDFLEFLNVNYSSAGSRIFAFLVPSIFSLILNYYNLGKNAKETADYLYDCLEDLDRFDPISHINFEDPKEKK